MTRHLYTKRHHAVVHVVKNGIFLGFDSLGINIFQFGICLYPGGSLLRPGAWLRLGRLNIEMHGGMPE
jgi:hypothetical protein